MIDMRLTGGQVNGRTTLRTLYKYQKEFESFFPDTYLPEMMMFDNKLWIVSSVRHHTFMTSEKITFIVANRRGEILNQSTEGYVQVPPGSYLGRYVVNLGSNNEIDLGKVRPGDVILQPSYWVMVDAIAMMELELPQGSMYQFSSVEPNMLPVNIQASFFGTNEKLAEMYNEYLVDR